MGSLLRTSHVGCRGGLHQNLPVPSLCLLQPAVLVPAWVLVTGDVGFFSCVQRSFFSKPVNSRLLTWRGPAWLCSREWFIMRNGLSAAADSQQHKHVVCRSNREARGGRERLVVSGRVKIRGVEVRGSVGLKTRPECNAIAL